MALELVKGREENETIVNSAKNRTARHSIGKNNKSQQGLSTSNFFST
jgi:hypothetical protein